MKVVQAKYQRKLFDYPWDSVSSEIMEISKNNFNTSFEQQ